MNIMNIRRILQWNMVTLFNANSPQIDSFIHERMNLYFLGLFLSFHLYFSFSLFLSLKHSLSLFLLLSHFVISFSFVPSSFSQSVFFMLFHSLFSSLSLAFSHCLFFHFRSILRSLSLPLFLSLKSTR